MDNLNFENGFTHSFDLDGFNPYIFYLKNILKKLQSQSEFQNYYSQIGGILDGQPSRFLRESISINTLKENGIFFTGHMLAKKLIQPISKSIIYGNTILDPACGTGDLLLACAEHLPIYKEFEITIDYWGKKLFGYDIYNQFIETTKLRLLLLAIKKGLKIPKKIIDSSQYFPNIKIKNFLEKNIVPQGIKTIVLNPPYTCSVIANPCSWGQGKISNAALFIEKCVKEFETGTRIVALLPDVLRTGSRYAKWRKTISTFSIQRKTNIIGKFDALTDIDVFKLDIQIKYNNRAIDNWHADLNNYKNKVVSDFFKVRVGAVVPFVIL